MGIDWIRTRPKAGVSRARLASLVEEQAGTFRASGYGRYEGEFDHLVAQGDAGREESARLATLELAEYLEHDLGPGCSHRVNSIALNPVLPAEWRLAAYRSYLPEHLPSLLRMWTTHLDQVRGGAHRGYLRDDAALDLRGPKEWSGPRASQGVANPGFMPVWAR